jgi:CRP-like cAMP-binding protein
MIRSTLLSHLPDGEIKEIAPLLTHVWLPADTKILEVEERLDYTYFPESAILAVVTRGCNGRNCYSGLYGHEGLGSISAVLGIPTSPNDEVVQRAGYAYRIRTVDLQSLLGRLPGLRRRLHRYVHVFMMQVAYTALANGCTRLDQRLARWLLMYQDRARISSLAITHQRLSEILGVRRSGVTEALHILEGERLIRGRRGLIDILNRPKLILLTGGSYGTPEAEYLRLV